MLFSIFLSFFTMLLFFGDFFFDIETPLANVIECYGIDEPELEMPETLSVLVRQQLGAHPVLGDSFDWGGLHWVVSEVKDHNAVQIGMCLPSDDQ